MNRLLPFLTTSLFFLGGCSTIVEHQIIEDSGISETSITPEHEIVDYEPGEMETDVSRLIPVKQETSKYIVVADKKGVMIDVHLVDTMFGDEPGLERQRWIVNMTNTTNKEYCVAADWRLMDFQFVSNEPLFVFMPPQSMKQVGDMVQIVWELDGVRFAPPASGYVHELIVADPIPINQLAQTSSEYHDRCTYLVKEEDIMTEADAVPEEDIVE